MDLCRYQATGVFQINLLAPIESDIKVQSPCPDTRRREYGGRHNPGRRFIHNVWVHGINPRRLLSASQTTRAVGLNFLESRIRRQQVEKPTRTGPTYSWRPISLSQRTARKSRRSGIPSRADSWMTCPATEPNRLRTEMAALLQRAEVQK